MRSVFRFLTAAGFITVFAVIGCGKKTMNEPPATTTEPPPAPAPTPTPPPPPPPTRPSDDMSSKELGDVFFDYDSFDLRPDARTTLDTNGQILMQSSGMRVTIEGHCDERGTVDYNLALGERRAQAAKDFLVSFGVGADRLQTISYGENRPFASGSDESAYSQNRRAHFAVQGR
jgi:peptidoglycan-associated lipoprotein